jgi:hypothetical protein
MYRINKAQAKDILINELGYSPIDADLYLRDFPPIHAELADAVEQWLVDRTIQDVEVSGLSITEVMQVRGYHFLMALRALNKILEPGTTPDRRKRMVESLRQPVPKW